MTTTLPSITSDKGFLLSRHSFDRRTSLKPEIHLWVSTARGPSKLIIENEAPVFFIERDDVEKVTASLGLSSIQYSSKDLNLKTFSQADITGLYFNSLREFYDARTTLGNNDISFYEGGIRLEERFLMERFIYAGVEFIGEESSLKEQNEKGFREYRNVKVKPSDFVPDFRTLSLDIECSEKGELYSIGFYSSDFKQVIMIQPETLSIEESAVDYIHWVNNEHELLKALEKTIQEYDPDILIGWNVINFDFRLLAERASLYHLKLKLGRDNAFMRWRDSHTEKNQGFISIDGRVVIDGIAALKAEAYSFPSFSLEAIGQHFLGRGKATDDVDNRLKAIMDDFNHNKVKLAEYNLQDCILVWDIFEKINLLDYLIFRSQLTGLELDRAGGSVAAFVNLYLPKLHRRGYVSPNLPEGGGLASPGGYVMSSKPGLYEHVLVLDFKSLYPSIIRTFKIDPLGLIEGQKDPDNAIEGFRGGCFSRDNHLLPDIITELWAQRDQAKKDNDKARSQAIKIIMNSFYGVLGSGGCPFYDTKLASSITLRGHEIMQQTAKWIEGKGYDVIYGDTDSTFVLLDQKISDIEANEIGHRLEKYINQQWQHKLEDEHKIECHLEIEFESHFSKFLMPTIRGSEHGSKKRYAGLLKSGDQETLIFKGLENVRTDWTKLAKDFQLQLYQMVFHGQDPTEFILQTVQDTLNGERDSDLVYRKRLRRVLDHYIKNVPPHVKAARIADAENLKMDKPQKYQHKGWISYLVTINGPQPLEYITSSIDYQFYVDRQIEPVADGILPFIGLSFKNMVDRQLGLFK
ncbi:MAG: DNA polymerase-2 [Enterobacterales bacterium]|jgi:DNA polymerase-2